MHIHQIMTPEPATVTPERTLQAAAEIMKKSDIGMLPVGEDDRLVGTLTDRDIVVRGLAMGLGPDSSVREAMTTNVLYCFDDEEVSAVTQSLGAEQVRRLPVVNREKRLVGLVSLGDVALQEESRATGQTLRDIVEENGPSG